MEKVSCAKRIKSALDVRGLKASDLCKMTGISKSTMSQYLNGLYEPGQLKTDIIARALHVDVAWLMGFDVPMEKERSTSVSESGPLPEFHSLMSQLTPEEQKLIVSQIKGILSNRE